MASINKLKLIIEAIIATEEGTTAVTFPQKVRIMLRKLMTKQQVYASGSALVIGSFIANVLSYLFNAYLGRVLSFSDFALIGLIGGFFSFASIPFGTYATTVTYKGSLLIGKYGEGAGYHFWKHTLKNVKMLSLVTTALWLLATPFLMQFFHTDNAFLFFLFSLVLLVGFFNYVNQGFLAARMMFGSLAIMSLIDPLTKLSIAFLLVSLGLQLWTFSAIPIAALVVSATGWLLLRKYVSSTKTTAPQKEIEGFSKKFFFLSFLTAFSSIAYFTVDIFLAKHFLTASDAGKYALISLVGKMIFFLGNLTSPFIIPLISRYEGAKKNATNALYALVGFTGIFTFIGFLLFGILSPITVPLLYGEKAVAIIPYLSFFTFGMMCYTISSVFVNYYLVKKMYSFTIAATLFILLQIGLISIFHANVQTIAFVMASVLTGHLAMMLLLHCNANRLKTYETKLVYAFTKKKGRKTR